jgi:endonuclease III
MSNQDNSATKQLEAVLNALQKSLLEASDEDVVKELRMAGVDPLKAKELMNFADERAVDEHFRRVRERLAQER